MTEISLVRDDAEAIEKEWKRKVYLIREFDEDDGKFLRVTRYRSRKRAEDEFKRANWENGIVAKISIESPYQREEGELI